MDKKIGTKKEAVLRFIDSRGQFGATDDEIQTGLGMDPSTERPRRLELYRDHRIAQTLETRPTRTGCKAWVWVSFSVSRTLPFNEYIMA